MSSTKLKCKKKSLRTTLRCPAELYSVHFTIHVVCIRGHRTTNANRLFTFLPSVISSFPLQSNT